MVPAFFFRFFLRPTSGFCSPPVLGLRDPVSEVAASDAITFRFLMYRLWQKEKDWDFYIFVITNVLFCEQMLISLSISCSFILPPFLFSILSPVFSFCQITIIPFLLPLPFPLCFHFLLLLFSRPSAPFSPSLSLPILFPLPFPH